MVFCLHLLCTGGGDTLSVKQKGAPWSPCPPPSWMRPCLFRVPGGPVGSRRPVSDHGRIQVQECKTLAHSENCSPCFVLMVTVGDKYDIFRCFFCEGYGSLFYKYSVGLDKIYLLSKHGETRPAKKKILCLKQKRAFLKAIDRF